MTRGTRVRWNEAGEVIEVSRVEMPDTPARPGVYATKAEALAAVAAQQREERIVAALEALAGQPANGPDGFAAFPAEARGATRETIWKLYDDLTKAQGKRPSRVQAAAALFVDESTLKRMQRDLGISGWPPKRVPPAKTGPG